MVGAMRSVRNWICCCLVVAGAAMPLAQSGETPARAGGQTPDAGQAPRATPAPPRISPQEHLAEAQRVLAGISSDKVPERGRKIFAQLQKDATTLPSKYGEAKASAEWLASFYDVERNVALLIGGGDGVTAPDAPKVLASPQTEVTDSATRAMIKEFRTHVELFYDAATRAPGIGSAPAASL